MADIESFVDVDGGRLYYEVNGSGDDLVFIHGFGLDHRLWKTQVAALKEHFRVISYDVRGFGLSSISQTNATSNIEDLAAILDQCNSNKATLIGHSMGSVIAADFSIKYPQRVSGLILANAIISHFQWPEEFLAEWAGYQDLSAIDMTAARTAWLNSETFGVAMADAKIAVLLEMMVNGYSGWHWQHSISVGRGCTEQASLANISMPTLLISGERDSLKYQHCAALLENLIPGLKRVEIKNAGHFCNLENSDKFNRELIAFVNNIALHDG